MMRVRLERDEALVVQVVDEDGRSSFKPGRTTRYS
jgi:hypothetical protein